MRLATESVVVVGAGIVGIATAYYLLREGAAVMVVDRAPEGDKASFGNAGGIAVTEVVPASVPGLAWRGSRLPLHPPRPLAVWPTPPLNLIPRPLRIFPTGPP